MNITEISLKQDFKTFLSQEFVGRFKELFFRLLSFIRFASSNWWVAPSLFQFSKTLQAATGLPMVVCFTLFKVWHQRKKDRRTGRVFSNPSFSFWNSSNLVTQLIYLRSFQNLERCRYSVEPFSLEGRERPFSPW